MHRNSRCRVKRNANRCGASRKTLGDSRHILRYQSLIWTTLRWLLMKRYRTSYNLNFSKFYYLRSAHYFTTCKVTQIVHISNCNDPTKVSQSRLRKKLAFSRTRYNPFPKDVSRFSLWIDIANEQIILLNDRSVRPFKKKVYARRLLAVEIKEDITKTQLKICI